MRGQAVDGSQDGTRIVGRDLHRQSGIAEGNDARLHKERLVFHKIARGGLGGLHAGRFYIVSRHAAGYIKSQDDRAFLFGQGDHCLRACQGNCQDGETQKEKHHGNVAAQARLAPFGTRCQTKAAVIGS